MEWLRTPYVLPLLITMILAALIGGYALRRRDVPGTGFMAALMGAVSIWSLFYALELAAGSAVTPLYWKLQYIGIVFIPWAWLGFGLHYSGYRGSQSWGSRRRLAPLLIFPLVTLGVVWTNELHGLFWRDLHLTVAGGLIILAKTYGPFFWAHTFYSYSLIACGTTVIWLNYWRTNSPVRGQAGLILFGALLPILGNVLYIFRLSPFPQLDLTPFAFTGTGLALILSLIRFHFLDLVPLAQDTILDSMSDGVVLADNQDRVIFVNAAAAALLGQEAAALIGQPLTEALHLLPRALIETGDGARVVTAQQEVELGYGDHRRQLDVRLAPLRDQAEQPLGRMVVWRDVTQRNRAEDALRESEQLFATFMANLPALAFIKDENQRVIYVNPFLREFFQTENWLGQRSSDLFPAATAMVMREEDARVLAGEHLEIKEQFATPSGDLRHFYTYKFPIQLNPQTRLIAAVILEVTAQQRAEAALQQQLQELVILHAVASACAEAQDEDELIGRVTRIVGEHLPLPNFGILVLEGTGDRLRYHASYVGLDDAAKEESCLKVGQGICGWVAQHGRPRNVPDTTLAPDYLPCHPPSDGAPLRAALAVPILAGERILGVLNVQSTQTNAFGEAEERLLVTLAGQLATAIERLRATQTERRRLEELLTITRVGAELAATLDAPGVLASIVRAAAEILQVDAAGVFTLDAADRFCIQASWGVGEAFAAAINAAGLPQQGTILGQAVTSGQVVQLVEFTEHPLPEVEAVNRLEGLRSMIALPLSRGADTLGALALWHRQPRRYTDEEEVFLQALAQQCVNAIENARVFEAERQRRLTAEALRATGQALTASLDVDTILAGLLDYGRQVVPYDAASLMQVVGDRVEVIQHRGFEQYGPQLFQFATQTVFLLSETPNLAEVVQTRRPLYIPDVSTYPGWVAPDESSPLRSWVGAPLESRPAASDPKRTTQTEVTALFSFRKEEPNFYRDEHMESLALLAGQASLALQNARLFEETQRRLREVTLLGRLIAITAGASDLLAALTQVCAEVAQYFAAPTAGYAQVLPGREAGIVVAEYTAPGHPSALGFRLPFTDNPSMDYIFDFKRPIAIYDAQHDPILGPVKPLMIRRGVASVIITPVILGGEVVGTLGVDNPAEHTFTAADLDLMESVGRQIGQALERLRLYQAADEHASQMAHLTALGERLNRPLTAPEVILEIGLGALELSHAARVALLCFDATGQAEVAWSQGMSAGWAEKLTDLSPTASQPLRQTTPYLIATGERDAFPWSASCHLWDADVVGAAIWPLVYEDRALASVISVFTDPNRWADLSDEVMLTFTRQAAVALQNAQLFEETRRQAIQQQALNAIITTTVAAPDLTTLLTTSLELTLQALDCAQGGACIDGTLVARGISEEFAERLRAHLPQTRRFLFQTIVLADTHAASPPPPLVDFLPIVVEAGIRALVVAPVVVEGRRIGSLSLACRQPRPWSAAEIALVEAVGRQVGSAAERLKLLALTRAQADQMLKIMDTVPEGVALLDPGGRILLANPAAWHDLASLNGEVDSEQVLTTLAERPFAALLRQAAAVPWLELEAPGARPATFELALRPLETNLAGEGWVMVLRDVTQERENQRRLQMQDRLATVGQLAAGIAHDFNNIMAAISVYSDLLTLDPALSPGSLDRLSIIQQQVGRANSLIRQILDFSRRSVMEQSDFDLLPFIKELDKLLARVLPENIRLELDVAPGSYQVHADPTRLQQVFMNLALNARDAMPGGGTLHFHLEHLIVGADPAPPAPPDRAALTSLQPGKWIWAQVRDTGAGIAADVLPHIFDPFFTTKPVGQGVGLGLAQVYGIIQQHGGTVEVSSEPGAGTTFSIYLPAQDQVAPPLTGGDGLEVFGGRGELILLVEDDEVARGALLELLTSQRYRVLAAANGQQALALFAQQTEPIQLVVSDVVMPEMGGVELSTHLQAARPGLRMLLITGHPLDAPAQEMLEQGWVRWLQKPFSARDFLRTLRELLD